MNDFSMQTVAVMSLAWFLLGVLMGRLGRSTRSGGARSERADRGPRQAPRNGGGGGGGGGSNGGRGGKVELYVGNLAYEIDDKELTGVFERYGKVEAVRIISKKADGQPRGYGFVEMADRDEAAEAVKALNGKEIRGRAITVNEARSRGRRR